MGAFRASLTIKAADDVLPSPKNLNTETRASGLQDQPLQRPPKWHNQVLKCLAVPWNCDR